MSNYTIEDGRYFLKDSVRKEVNFMYTDQNMGYPVPIQQRECLEGQSFIELPDKDTFRFATETNLFDAINNRKSRRNFTEQPLNITELSFLLWSTQGIRKEIGEGHTLRTVPSAGCRHSFETYIAAINIKDLDKGIYRYLPLNNRLVFERQVTDLEYKLTEASLGQEFTGNSSAVFIWSTIPYRMEWRYDRAAHKVIAIDIGHVCQNLYLACEAVNAGTCAIAAYDQEKMNKLINADGRDEFVIYLAPVGKV